MSVQTSRRPQSPAPGSSGRVPPVIPTQPGSGGRGPGGGKKKRTKRKDPLWAKLTLVLGAVLMVTSGVAIVGSKAVIGQATDNIAQRNLLGGAGKSEAEGGNSLEGPIDMLLLGVDARERWAADDVRSDTIIILHIPASHDQAYLISIPRDTEARIPAFEKSGYKGGTDKINAAFFHGAQNGGGWEGGAQLMAKTIKSMTGIGFDGAAIINFGGFKSVIDALGSVRICVSHEVKSHHMSYVDGKAMWNADAKKTGKPYKAVVHKKGCREMEGWEALDYSRQRYGLPNSDYDRQQNQQQLIKAMAKKATEGGMLTNPLKLNSLMKAAGKAFVLDTGGVPIADFIFTLKNLNGNDLVTLRTNGGTFAGNGNGRETFNETTMDMFQAVKSDKLADFVVNNPDVLSTRK
ncbi:MULTISPECIES: LCP family protein [Micromonospora]|uniref:LytR family transcriptional regulator n=1 Tax=Micromonospora tulbaghiae TaxID=479978 RepID=A0A386WRC5_9ACTN|nr:MULTISPECIES: LCP family protein [Micromonospora]AYF30945.1 LytR family transcriptional regulator [Micromonospora tulbaghiae]MBC9001914.1 LCP family protein [Micromonospora aurantiaca]MCO1616894.1 LCP family protein [Micromonospora sp. CPM1]RLQ07131.1 LytR family transcriptional regulator [Micromonospora sp. BL1]